MGDILPEAPLKILIVTGRTSEHRARELSLGALAAYQVNIVSNIAADPTIDTVDNLVNEVRSVKPDWIIAIGGGSVIDSAKAASVLAENVGDTAKYLNGEMVFARGGAPVIAVPTTAGSGSEVTPYASITDKTQMSKNSLSDRFLYPKYAVLDPDLLLSLSPYQTGVSGMDALSHSIEGYWSNRSTPVTDALAISAANRLLMGLPRSYSHPDDTGLRRMILEGSMLAGLTISNARTTAVHSISYPITVYYGVPHGLACSLILPSVIRYNDGAMEPGKQNVLLDSLGFTSMEQLALEIENIQRHMDLPVTLRQAGLNRDDIAVIIENGFRPDRMNNNPRKLSIGDLGLLLENILG